MRIAESSKLLWGLAPAAVLAFAAAMPGAGCANSASDCALLGLPDGCTPDGTGGSTSSTTGTGGSTSSTTGTGGAGTGGMGAGGMGAGGTGTGGAGTGGVGTGGSAPASTLPLCARKQWGDAQSQAIRGLATDAQGLVLAGDFQGSIDLGKGPLAAGPSGSMFVARLDQTLSAVWTNAYGASLRAIAADGKGNVFVAGRLLGAVDFGCGALDPASGAFFLAKLDVAGGCTFSRNYAADVVRASLTVEPSGQAVLAGGANGPIDFGQLTPPASHGGSDIFIARFDDAGQALLVRSFGTASDDEVAGLVVDASGRVFVGGTFTGAIDFGSGDGAIDSKGHVGAFVAAFNASLGATWSRGLPSANDVTVAGVVPVASGGIAVGGTFLGSIDVGPPSPLSLANGGLFLAWIDAAGATSKGASIPGLAPGDITAMAAGASGDVAIAGSRGDGLYLAHVKSDGSVAYEGTATGTGGVHRANAAVFSDASTVMLGGSFDGTLAATGTQTITSAGSDDALLLKVCLPAP